MPDWNFAKEKVKMIVQNNGDDLVWLQRIVSGSNFNTGSTISYGYGDIITYYRTGSLKGMLEPINEKEIILDPGHSIDDYVRFYIDPDHICDHHDIIEYPSGSGVRYEIQPIRTWRSQNVTISKIITCRRMIPFSGSMY